MKVVVATDSFKGTLSSRQAGEAIAAGVSRAAPGADVDVVSVADGGEGTVEAALEACGGELRTLRVHGPLGDPVEAAFAVLADGERAVIEMSAASGLPLLDPSRYQPLVTSTYGTGELLVAALDAGCRRIDVAVGGSATVDGGIGAAQALGVRFLTTEGDVMPAGMGGGALDRIAGVDLTGRDRRLDQRTITVLCDVTNPLCGPQGAARAYGPQKGADTQEVERLDRNLVHLAEIVRRQLGVEIDQLDGSGAAGGLAGGLVAFAGATLARGIEVVLDLVQFDHRLAGANLVITGEGRLDEQSLMGKTVGGVARRARSAGVPVIAIPGSASDEGRLFGDLLSAWHPLYERPPKRLPPGEQSCRLLASKTEAVMSTWPGR